MIKKIISLLIIICILTSFSFSQAEIQYTYYADKLSQIGVFKGTGNGFELEREPTRLEGLIMLIRLLGQEEEALTLMDLPTVFTDVPLWGNGYVNYGYDNSLVYGATTTQYGSNDKILGKSYITLILRALGYDDKTGDFAWNNALDFAKEKNLINTFMYNQLVSNIFTRDFAAKISFDALKQKMKNEEFTLAEYLVSIGSIDQSIAENIEILFTPLTNILNQFIELPEEIYDFEEVDKIKDRISVIPNHYINILVSKDVRLRLTNGPITDEPEYEYLRGVVPRGWESTGLTWDDVPGAGGKLIVVRIGYSEQGMGHGSYNLELHEVGHQIDHSVFFDYEKDSYSEDFMDIADIEKDLLFNGNDYFDYFEEYFAETFAMFYLNNETRALLLEKAPLTYNYFLTMEDLF